MSKYLTQFRIEKCESMMAGCWFQRKADGTIEYYRITDVIRGVEGDY